VYLFVSKSAAQSTPCFIDANCPWQWSCLMNPVLNTTACYFALPLEGTMCAQPGSYDMCPDNEYCATIILINASSQSGTSALFMCRPFSPEGANCVEGQLCVNQRSCSGNLNRGMGLCPTRMSPAVIAVIVIAAFLAVAMFLVWCCRRRYRRNRVEITKVTLWRNTQTSEQKTEKTHTQTSKYNKHQIQQH